MINQSPVIFWLKATEVTTYNAMLTRPAHSSGTSYQDFGGSCEHIHEAGLSL